jgi:redox-sensitive bicupin YhaK (pirin superfamily)
MITIRKSGERGYANRGWLEAYQTFSFGDYYDASHMGFRTLRVLNDDRIAPGMGFGPHAHRDMEIITYVLEGGLLHRDSMGERHVLRPNEVQTMSAGAGIVHSEFNASETELVHSIQIWILPEREDVEPSYQQIAFPSSEKHGRLRLLAGPTPSEGATVIHQDAYLYAAELAPEKVIQHALRPNRHAWVQAVRGAIALNDQILNDGDGASVSGEDQVFLAGGPEGGEFLLFDLA